MKRVFIIFAVLSGCGKVTPSQDGGVCPEGQTLCGEICVDTTSDNLNCGECGKICMQPDHGKGECKNSQCVYECLEGWWDNDNNIENGCEYECTLSGKANDVCNGIDDDCDSFIDEDAGINSCPKGAKGLPCATSCGSIGTQDCDEFCKPLECKPPQEACNGIDDDCDTIIDNGFECAKDSPTSCETVCGTTGTGVCSSACTKPAPPSCTPPPETCNFIDDNCNGSIDEGVIGITAGPIEISDANSDPRPHAILSFGNSKYVALWRDYKDDPPTSELYSITIDKNGTKSNSTRLTANNSDEMLGDIEFSNDKFTLAYYSYLNTSVLNEIFMANLDENGFLTGFQQITQDIPNNQDYPSITWNGDNYGLVYLDDRNLASHYQVYFSLINASFIILLGSEKTVSTEMQNLTYPDISWSGNKFGVVWTQKTTLSESINFRAINSDGSITDQIKTITSDEYIHVGGASIEWIGRGWVVSWAGEKTDEKGYYIALLTEDGNKIPDDTLITQMISNDSIEEDKKIVIKAVPEFEIIGIAIQKQITMTQTDIIFYIYDFNLRPLLENVQISSEYSRFPRIAWDGSGFGFVFFKGIPIYFARFGCPVD